MDLSILVNDSTENFTHELRLAAVGDKLPGSWQVYDQYDYLPEQAAAYSAWCQRLQTLTSAPTC